MKILYCDWLDLFYAIDQRLAEKQQVWKKCQVRGIHGGRNPRLLWDYYVWEEFHMVKFLNTDGRNHVSEDGRVYPGLS